MPRSSDSARRTIRLFAALLALPLAVSNSLPATAQNAPVVSLARAPRGAMQPEVVTRGNDLYMVFLQGDPAHADVFYSASTDAGATFSVPVRVNTTGGDAIALGTVRGARIALGAQNRVYVAWNGSGPNASMYFTRMRSDGNFEPERNLMTHTCHLDGGGALAADSAGHVYVAWHGHEMGGQGESTRAVFVTRSSDGGRSFAPEAPAWPNPTGACGCCQVSLEAGSGGQVWLIYRSATEDVERDIYVLHSTDAGATFTGNRIHRWHLDACPLSTFALTRVSDKTYAAWVTQEQIYFSPISDQATAPAIQAAPGTGDRNHPALAVNADGDVLLVWSEGTGWAKGGSLAWQTYTPTGTPIAGGSGSVSGLPAWSFAAASAGPDGGFRIYY